MFTITSDTDSKSASAGGLPAVLSAIYNENLRTRPVLADRILPVIATPLAMGNVIVEAAIESSLPLIDLGRALGEPEKDYANPIEPSAHGGEKIAEAVLEVYDRYDFDSRKTEIHT